MTIIAGGIDQGGEPAVPNQYVAGPQIAMQQGGGRIGGKQVAEPGRQPLHPLAPGPVEQAGGRDQPLLAPEARPVAAFAIVERDRAERIVGRPAIGLAAAIVQPPNLGADVGPGPGAEHGRHSRYIRAAARLHARLRPSALECRRRASVAQHRRFGAERRSALGDRQQPVRPPHQQHFGEVSAGQPFEPVLRDAGQLGDAAGEGAHRVAPSLRDQGARALG